MKIHGLGAGTTERRIREVLETADIRPTRQRILIADIMLCEPQHLSADHVLLRANARGPKVSKATVYNTLSLFAQQGLIREVIVDPQRVFYDSNTSEHHHIYNEDDGSLRDTELGGVAVENVPNLPEGTEIRGVEVIVRVGKTNAGAD